MPNLIPAWIGDTLMPVEKLDVHRRGLRHVAVSVFVLRGEELLIQRRALGKYHTPGLWANSCCTHPTWGERPEDCAMRRMQEELGITGIHPNHRGEIEYHADVGNGLIEHEVVDLYLAYATPEMTLAPDAEEVMDLRWIGLYDLADEVARHPSCFTPWLRIYLADHASSIFGTPIRG